ncbi:MAG: hypothetical protein AAF456_00880 [Planctomycetota bacterium]
MSRNKRSPLSFNLRTAVLVMTALSIGFAFVFSNYMTRVAACQRALDALDEYDVWFTVEEEPERSDSLLARITGHRPRRITRVYFHMSKVVGEDNVFHRVMPLLAGAPVDAIELDGAYMLPKTEEIWEKVAAIGSLKSIDIGGFVKDATVMKPIENLNNLESFSSSGSSGGCSREVLEFLITLPNLKEIGLPAGEFSMPDDLKEQRPDIEYFVTDFPA